MQLNRFHHELTIHVNALNYDVAVAMRWEPTRGFKMHGNFLCPILIKYLKYARYTYPIDDIIKVLNGNF